MRLVIGFTLLVGFVLAGNAAAQTRIGWDVTLKGGWASGGFYGGNHENAGSSARNGFAAGLAAEYLANETLGFEFGVWYVQKGSYGRVSNELNNSPSNPPRPPADVVEGDVNLEYLNFNLLFAAHGEFLENDVKVFIGPGLGNLLSSEFDGTVNGTPENVDLDDNLKNVDFTIVIGAGFAYALERVDILLDARAEFGTRNIAEADNFDLRTRAFIVTVGVGLPVAR